MYEMYGKRCCSPRVIKSGWCSGVVGEGAAPQRKLYALNPDDPKNILSDFVHFGFVGPVLF